jgi:hypothetical protein
MVERLIEHNKSKGWRDELNKSKAKIWWFQGKDNEAEQIDWLCTKGKILYKYPAILDLARKDVFAQVMQIGERFGEQSGEDAEDEYDFFPRSFVLP